MGKNITKLEYCAEDFQQFQQCLYQQLEHLKEVLVQPNFGKQTLKFGAELEMYLVDEQGQVSLSNQMLLKQLDDPQFQPELNQYNLELNLSAVAQEGRPFSQLRQEIQQKTDHLQALAKPHGISIVPIGILPTLRAEHLNSEYMTDLGRYHCLSQQLYQQRGDDFKININGEEPVNITVGDICAEGANTSFQVHMMTPFDKFKQVFNAAQLTLPLVTAIGANSPIFLGNRLWDETRIALFKQSIDIRNRDDIQWQQPARVNFGFGWLRSSVWEIFAEAVSLYSPILPVTVSQESYRKQDSQLPELSELSLHMGTLWPWHRPVYDHHGNGHMRIEFRAIPAGPTSIDMVANAAFAIGLANGMSDTVDEVISVLPFKHAEYNFYRAAQSGLNAKILWPLHNKYQPEEVPISTVIKTLIPVAKSGLAALAVAADEIDLYIGIIEQRLAQNITGAIWQQQAQKFYEQQFDKDTACKKLVMQYIKNSQSCEPVANWERLCP
ncbi:hypothetical protein [Thalassotalea sp. ND16A]|uniref:hypothetical protein n=1 Tax=Thalassotalea sp. ND16A TaxID=1535422 RepID=UPI00051A2918|nr:hypothetical protein [Thalassotalea sp. ND16A]KGJ95740.1 hypothetical protein ND16A_1275 [Thalassotalea sp. ND16A]